MLYLETYKKLGLNNENDVFNYFINNLRNSNQTFDFFVDWCKVFHNLENIEIELNLLNYLIGKDNAEEELYKLIEKYPDIVPVLPILIAIRNKELTILSDYKTPNWEYKTFSFRKKKDYKPHEINSIVEFCSRQGFLDLLKNKKIKNLVDYCIGIEVGIGTNARKNRSGKIMEDIIEWHISELCDKLNLQYITQATRKTIREKWNIELPTDKTSRQYDFAILNANNKLTLIETNFYSAGGSKLKSVAGEFQTLDMFLKEEDSVANFIWITDGQGWLAAKLPLEEAFLNTNFILNTRLIFDGALEEIVKLGGI